MNNKTGEIIEKYRKEKGLTQGELAKKLGVSNTAISKWEHGYNLPDIALLEPISKVLDIDLMLLLTTENIEKEQTSPKNKHKKISSFINITIIILLFLSVITSICFLLSNHYNKKIEKLKEEQTKSYRFYNDSGEFLVNGYIFFNNEESIVVIDYIKHQLHPKSINQEEYVFAEMYLHIDGERIFHQNQGNSTNNQKELSKILDKLTTSINLEENINDINDDKGEILIQLTNEDGKIIKYILKVKIQPII